MDIERISQKIREEKDNIVAKAFTCQIASLLMTNGIVPIMTEYRKNDLEAITDTDRYKLVYELGVTFDRLDTTEHDKQIRAEVIEEVRKLICDYLYSNNIHLIKIAKDEADTPIYPYKMADDIYEQLKENNNE